MSANTNISEGGKGRPFGPVKALMVEGEDGKFYSWNPEADRALDSLSVDKNGIYRASDRGVYGWSWISVNVPQNEGVTGKDPDTGEEVYVHPDPETGELVEDVLPVRIEVTTSPTKTEYTDGETIDYSGIEVHAYSRQNVDLGEVLFNELVLAVQEAEYDPQKVSKESTSTYNGNTCVYCMGNEAFIDYNVSMPQLDGTIFSVNAQGTSPIYAISWSESSKYSDSSYVHQELISLEPFDYSYYNKSGKKYEGTSTQKNANPFTYYTAILTRIYARAGDCEFRPSMTGEGLTLTAIEVCILFGDRNPIVDGSIQPIPVQWPRPGDGAVLETTFDILVGPHGGTGDD